jgi:ATP-binding cassette subfamily F protein uup
VINDFPGNYSDYRAYEGNVSFSNNETQKKAEKKVIKTEAQSTVEVGKSNWKEKQKSGGKLNFNEQKEYSKLEREIAQLERDKEVKEKLFLNPDLTQDQIQDASKALQEILNSKEEKEMRWFELAEKLES